MILKSFKKVMFVVNCLMAAPVIYIIIKELSADGTVRPARILTTALLMAIPLCSTIAITITGSAVLKDK